MADSETHSRFDTIVVGAGFYGCCLALFAAQHSRRTLLLEREDSLLTRASFVNQARVHNGYHYPRSFMTAVRSVMNFPRFVLDFRSCVDDTFEKIYAVARQNSKVSAYQFRSFCQRIGAPVRPAHPAIARLFNSALIEAAFSVEEYAFDATKLRNLMAERLAGSSVELRLGTEALRIEPEPDGEMVVVCSGGERLLARRVFNCTYSRLNTLLRASGAAPLQLKHEITELALVEPPEPVRRLGVTVMDGPFFSTMPFPACGLHSFSHVRYTPHDAWLDEGAVQDPHRYLKERTPQSRFTYMLHDAQRYMPCLVETRYVRSLFEVKTVLQSNEVDDGRPILLRPHPELGNLISVMGGKIDNIYDVLESLNRLHDSAKGRASSALAAS